MTTHVLKGSKQEIAERLAKLSGEVREAIVFVEEPSSVRSDSAPKTDEDIFADMVALMVDVPGVDDSRESIYSRSPGE